jgi:3-hydroxyisobutyrate dehydrogenase-like beta-hydroxyacid dehydrogenase
MERVGHTERVGFIGLGLMGSAMAGRLLEYGTPLTVYNRTSYKARPLVERGAEPAYTPSDVGKSAAITITMLFDGAAVREVLGGTSPGEGLRESLGPGHLHIDMSTVGPADSRTIAEIVRGTGARFIDAPVLGSTGPAASGELLVFAGGEAEDVDRARPILSLLGKKILHAGEAGQGNALKITANMMLGRMCEAIGEAVSLAARQGLSPEILHEMLQSGAISSPTWDRIHSLAAADPPLRFPIGHILKDLGLVSDAARRLGIRLPVHDTVRSLFEEAASQQGGSVRDYSWLARWLMIANGAAR